MFISLKRLFIIIISIFISSASMAADVIADWSLNGKTGEKVIVDSTGKYNLTEQVSQNGGAWSGYCNKYFSPLDMRNVPWTLEGSFQTAGVHSGISVIAGNRSVLSNYTGWDFIMIDGSLRILAVKDKMKSGKVQCPRRFDDGKMHNFVISWNPADGSKGSISLVIDKKYKYFSSGAGDLGEQSSRFFGIGCQPAEDGKVIAWQGGSLKDFKFTKGAVKVASSDNNVAKYDAEMRTDKGASNNIQWIDASALTLEGKGWKETPAPYGRLPLKYKSIVRPAVWSLSTHSSGIAVRFSVENTKFIKAKWSLRHDCYLPHMTPLGVSGLDLYVKLHGKWCWAGVGKPSRGTENEVVLKSGFPQGKKFEFLLYLPLYNVTSKLQLGFSPGAKVETVPERGKPIVVYGTSIVHGCSASRPGMNWPAMLGRRFDLPIVNLGFSGSGTTDPEFADILADIPASVYVIDCLPNMAKMKSKEICDRTVYLVTELRKKRPDTPIVLVEDRTYAYPNIWESKPNNYRREGLKSAYEKLLENKTGKLWYVEGEGLVGYDNEGTVDGSHPTDLGMYRYCEKLEPVIREAVGNKKANLSQQVETGKIEAKMLDLHARIYPDRFPENVDCYMPVSVPRNSSSGFQLAFRSLKKKYCVLSLSEVKNRDGKDFQGEMILKPLLAVHVEGNTQGAMKSRPGGEAPASWYASFIRKAPFDVLEAVGDKPLETLELEAGKTAGGFLEIKVPADALPGTYHGQVVAKYDTETVKLPFSFKVHKTFMPEKLSLDSSHWLWPQPENLQSGKDVAWWSEEHWKLLMRAGKLLRENGDNIIFTPLINYKYPLIQAVQNENGNFYFDYSKFDRWIDMFSKLGFKYFSGRHLSRLNKNLYVKLKKTGELRKFDENNTEWFKFLSIFLKDFYKHLKDRKLTDKYIQYIYDEPPPDKLGIYKEYASIFRTCMPGIRSIDAINSKPRMFTEMVDIMVFNFVGISTRQDLVESRRKLGKEVFLYHCTSPYPPFPNRHLDRPLTESRLWPWLCEKFNASGFLFWAANLYRGVPDEYKTSLGPLPSGSQNPGHPPGDAWLYYRAPSGLIPSLRIISFREGMTDVTLWTMLKSKAPEQAKELMGKLIFPEIFWNHNWRGQDDYLKKTKSLKRGYAIKPAEYNNVRTLMLNALDQD